MGNRRHTTPTIIWIVSLLTISAVIAKKAPPKVEGIYEDWNGVIDKLEIVKRPRVADFARVMVEPFDTKSTQLPKQDDNTYEPTTVVLSKATTIFSEGVQKSCAGKLEVTVGEPPATGDAGKGLLLIRGTVSEMNPGSRAARYWGGFGAGKSRVEITGEIVNAETGVTLLRFKHARVSSMGGFGGDYTKLLTKDTREVGEDIGNLLIEF